MITINLEDWLLHLPLYFGLNSIINQCINWILPSKTSLVIQKEFLLLNLQVKGVLVCLELCRPLFVPFLPFMHIFSPALKVPLAITSAILADYRGDLVFLIPPPPSWQNIDLLSFCCLVSFRCPVCFGAFYVTSCTFLPINCVIFFWCHFLVHRRPAGLHTSSGCVR